MSNPSFNTFLWAGFECTAALAAGKKRLNLLSATKHDVYTKDDYELVSNIGIKTVREGLEWSRIDKGNNEYNFAKYEQIMKTGAEQGIQQIWDLNHFDYPHYLDPFSKEFVSRFATYAQKAVKVMRKYEKNTLYIVPICEISFFAWIGADQGHWAPYLKGSKNGLRFKKQLVKASIVAIDAIRAIDDNVRFILVDPFMRRVAKEPASKKALDHTQDFNEVIRFEAWDMLCGKKYPELGGDPKYLDIIGVNYYLHNQEWVLSSRRYPQRISHRMMSWESPGRVPFGSMLQDVYNRYKRPIVVSETGSFGRFRYRWWERVLREVKACIEDGLPIHGMCAYPTVDRPHWAGFLMPKSGLWDFQDKDESCRRIAHKKSLSLIKQYSEIFAQLPTRLTAIEPSP